MGQGRGKGKNGVGMDHIPAPPDGGWGWFVVLGSFLLHVIINGIFYSFGVFYMEFLTYFKGGIRETARVFSIVPGVALLVGPVASALTNRYGCRAVTIAGAIVAAIGFILSLFAPNIYYLFFSFGVLSGLGFGLMYLPAIVSVSHYFDKKRSLAIGIAVSGSGIGTFIFAPVSKLLVDEYTWKGAVLIEAGIILNCILCGALFRPLVVKHERADIEYDTKKSEKSEKEKLMKSVLKDVVFLLFSISNICTSIGFNMPYIYLPDRAHEYGINKTDATNLISVIGIANTISRVVFGWMADKPWVNRLMLYNTALFICGVATALSPLNNSYPFLICYAAVFGASMGVYVGLNSVVLVDLLGLAKLTNAFGLLLMFQGLATFIGPPIFGWLYDVTGSYDISFYVAGTMVAISGAMLYFLPLVQKCLGSGFGLMYLPAIVSVSHYFDEKRSLATGVVMSGSGIGTFIFAPVSKLLVDEYTWKGAVLIEAGIILNCILCGALFRPLVVKHERADTEYDTKKSEKSEKEKLMKSVLKDVIFLLFTISNICTIIGFMMPYIYLPHRALEYGINKTHATFLISVIGIANTIGRVVFGWMADKPWVNRPMFYNTALIICGMATALSPLNNSFPFLVCYAAVFGASMGVYVVLNSVVLVDLLGLAKLTNAFGLLLMFQGLATFIGPPIAGWLYDGTGSYDISFYVAGTMVAISGAMLYFLPLVQKCLGLSFVFDKCHPKFYDDSVTSKRMVIYYVI
uniref:Monocarboxylate transporter 13 n=1 Tax=Magallana gigas TaxID=29159 RepID=A0A8W8IN66_MAGGI